MAGLGGERLIVFTPLPPAMNGIADYSHHLLPALRGLYECYCIVPDDAPRPDKIDDVQIMFLREYVESYSLFSDARHIFQIGNNAGHRYMLPWLARSLGVSVIHDGNLAGLLDLTTGERGRSAASPPNWGRMNATRPKYSASDLSPAATGAADLKDQVVTELTPRVMSEASSLKPILQSSPAVIAHSKTVALRVAAESPEARVFLIPHIQFPSSNRPYQKNSAVRILSAGFVSSAKRIDVVLDALSLLKREFRQFQLTIVGFIDVASFDLEHEIEKRGLAQDVRLIGYCDEQTFTNEIAGADIVMCLRHPTSGETSGVLIRSLSAGRCCVVTDVGAFAEVPDDCVIKIPLSQMESGYVAERLRDLATNPEYRESIGKRGRLLIERIANPPRIGSLYQEAIEQAYRQSPASLQPASRTFSFLPDGKPATAVES